jgi:DNA-directed RNA polymerase specialized sigma54-like protein
VYQEEPEHSNLPEIGGNSYEEAYRDLDNDETNFWPNDAYQDFLQLIAHYHISDNIANAFIEFFNQHGNMKVSPLPRSMHKAKKLIKSTFVSRINFQKVSISIVLDQECFLYYHSIINAIKSLVSVASINENLVLEYKENYQNGEKFYEEQFNANWWKREELALING